MELRFCATGKTGLGHLRRLTNIATALRQRNKACRLTLTSNAPVAGLTEEESALFDSQDVVERDRMAGFFCAGNAPLVVDTAVLPGIERIPAPLCLVLRETIAERVNQFRLGGQRAWDLVIIPNPDDHWRPPNDALAARKIENVGWIFRRPDLSTPPPAAAQPTVLIATGGGGSGPPWEQFRHDVEKIVARVRKKQDLHVVQSLGPRAGEDAKLRCADRIVRPGGDLPGLFAGSDAVITTVGYNSVLELACTATPALLIPIPRSYDDQGQRARRWGPVLGHAHEEVGRSADWLAATMGRRRAPVDLGPSGEQRAAQLLEALA